MLPDDITILVPRGLLERRANRQLRRISLRYGIRPETLRKYIRRSRYPIWFIRELEKTECASLFEKLERQDAVLRSKWHSVTIPKDLTPRLAYFVGYLQGDGCLEANQKRTSFCDEYEEQLDVIHELCISLFNVVPLRYATTDHLATKPAHRLTIGSRVVNHYLHTFFGIPVGHKDNLRIPPCLRRKRELLRWYLVGLFDADGTLPKNPNGRLFIDITFKDLRFIEEIRDALATFGIQTLKPYCRVAKSPSSSKISRTWELRIRRRDMIKKHLKMVGFAHPDKRRRSQAILSLGS
jgi:hypothetical protein